MNRPELTFGALLQLIKHEMRKGAEQRARLVPLVAPFVDYCFLNGHRDIQGTLKGLQSLLVSGPVEEIARLCSDLEGQVNCRQLEDSAPEVKNHEVLMYRFAERRLGLLFAHQPIKFAMAALIRNLFGYEKLPRKTLVGDLKDNDLVICDSSYGAMLKATAVRCSKCIIVDANLPPTGSCEIHISLPMTIQGLKTICDELLSPQ